MSTTTQRGKASELEGAVLCQVVLLSNWIKLEEEVCDRSKGRDCIESNEEESKSGELNVGNNLTVAQIRVNRLIGDAVSTQVPNWNFQLTKQRLATMSPLVSVANTKKIYTLKYSRETLHERQKWNKFHVVLNQARFSRIYRGKTFIAQFSFIFIFPFQSLRLFCVALSWHNDIVRGNNSPAAG